jgi:hypothetical protein
VYRLKIALLRAPQSDLNPAFPINFYYKVTMYFAKSVHRNNIFATQWKRPDLLAHMRPSTIFNRIA